MKEYELLPIIENEKHLVVSLSYISPLDDIESLEKELSLKKVKGIIVFELLLCNGIGENRYVKMCYDGVHFDMNSMEISSQIDEDTKKIALNYYRENPIYIDNSILPDAQIFLIKKGECI